MTTKEENITRTDCTAVLLFCFFIIIYVTCNYNYVARTWQIIDIYQIEWITNKFKFLKKSI